MSSSRALSGLPSNMTSIFFFVQCIIKQLDSVFVMSRIIKVSVRVISLLANYPYLDLDYSGHHINLIQRLFRND